MDEIERRRQDCTLIYPNAKARSILYKSLFMVMELGPCAVGRHHVDSGRHVSSIAARLLPYNRRS